MVRGDIGSRRIRQVWARTKLYSPWPPGGVGDPGISRETFVSTASPSAQRFH